MAKEYLDKLTLLIDELNIDKELMLNIEVKHFFSGAAVYYDKKICASWSPAGLAFKLSEKRVDQLLKSGKALPLKYFPGGHVKKGYVLFENPENKKPAYWLKYFIESLSSW